MQEQDGLTAAQRELERALSSVAPIPAAIDPIAAAFAAGRRSMRRRVRAWQSTAAALMLATAAGSWLLSVRRDPVVAPDRLATLTVAPWSHPTPSQPLPAESLLMLQEAIQAKGLDGLPAARLPAADVVPAGDAL